MSIGTDSVQTSPATITENELTLDGYAVRGRILGHHPGDPHLFNIYIGEK